MQVVISTDGPALYAGMTSVESVVAEPPPPGTHLFPQNMNRDELWLRLEGTLGAENVTSGFWLILTSAIN